MKFLKTLVAPILAAVLAASAAQGAFYQWSKTSASNSNADPTINWAEGMSPSSVNDSARAMMARAAEYRDDISGALVTGGTSTAYTLTTNQGLTSTPTDGQLIAFSMHATNGNAPTLRADGGTAFPIQTSPGVAVASSTLILGSPYTAKFSAANSAWMLRDFFSNANIVPLGTVLPYAGSTAPNSNFVLAFGQCISRTTFASFFAQVGTAFGVCDGTTTFGVPDLRGRSAFGVDNMGGSAANRITVAGGNFDGTVFGGTGGAQNQTLTLAQIPSHNHAITDPGHNHNVNNQGNLFAIRNDLNTGSGFTASTNAVTAISVQTNTTGITINNNGGGGSHPIMPPTVILSYIVRVL